VPVLGTNPIAFAAPARRNRHFLLDMSTSTVAQNKVKVYDFQGRPLPAGWVLDEDGNPVTDSALAMDLVTVRHIGGMTALGGTAEMSSHKGYGLSVMVQILSATLAGGSFTPIRKRTQGRGDPDNIGHFLMALDPTVFREEGEFEDDLDQVIDVLHAAKPVVDDEPVLVAGEPEACRARSARAPAFRCRPPSPKKSARSASALVPRSSSATTEGEWPTTSASSAVASSAWRRRWRSSSATRARRSCCSRRKRRSPRTRPATTAA
jgi:hypothetical protein